MIKVIGFVLVVMNTGGGSPMVRYDELTSFRGAARFEDRESCIEAAKVILENRAGSLFLLACMPVIEQ